MNNEGEKRGGPQVPLDPLVDVIAALRQPDGCPWDREQTHTSLRSCLIEECYEVVEAIDENDMNKLKEELGDLLLQIVFHAQMAEEAGVFDLNEVIEGIVKKMVRRHPHVFGTEKADDSDAVVEKWENIKQREREQKAEPGGALGRVPLQLPALMRAYKIQERAARIGFDWPHVDGAWDKLKEEAAEVKAAAASGDPQALTEELGDLLFAAVNVSRFFQVEPELALAATTAKFERRFHYLEQEAKQRGMSWEELSLQELDEFWEEAKRQESET